MQAYRTAITDLKFQDVPVDDSGLTLLCDVSTGRQRPVVPQAWRRRVFDAVHGLSHPAIRTTCKLVTSKFVWHGIAKQVKEWAKPNFQVNPACCREREAADISSCLSISVVISCPASMLTTHRNLSRKKEERANSLLETIEKKIVQSPFWRHPWTGERD